MKFIFYSANYVAVRNDLPMRKFGGYFSIYGPHIAPIDRTGTIKMPVQTHSLFPVPEFKEFRDSYETTCFARAAGLLEHATKLDCPICVMWSGGIDSTAALVSLLSVWPKVSHERITVLLSEDSINEYPRFYECFIRGKLRARSAITFSHLLGTARALIVNGEGNDQLFGSDVIADAIREFGIEAVQAPYSGELLQAFFERRMSGNTALADFYVHLFERLKAAAPVPIESNFDHLWWINFALKWQTVFIRALTYVPNSNKGKVSREWVEQYYQPFYMTPNFQLWSMNNINKRISSDWVSYKYPAKELIYNFTRDPVYRDNKIKRGSLQYLISHQHQCHFVTEDYEYPHDVEPAEFYNEDHDFR